MNDRPGAGELIEAVRMFLEKELLPGLTDPRLRFQALVSANVLAVAGRELTGEEEQLLEEWRLLAPMLGEAGPAPAGTGELRRAVRGMNARLCSVIREGGCDEPGRWREVAAVVRRLVLRKLEVAKGPLPATGK
jgi:hypothetical protein